MHCERCGQANAPGEVFCTNTSCNAYLGWSKPSILPDASQIALAPESPPAGPPPAKPPAPPVPPTAPRPSTGAVPIIPPPPRAPQPAPQRSRGLSALLSPPECEVAPGSGTATVLRIKNTGEVVERPTISVRGVPAHWVTIDPQTVDLFTNAEASVTVRFHPPRLSDTPHGRVPFAVDAVSTIPNPDTGVLESVSARQSGALTVGQFHDLAAVLRPAESEAKRRTKHTVLLANRGNATERTTIVAQDRGDQVSFATPYPMIELPAGRDAGVPLDLTTRKRKWVGGDRRHQFTVDVKGNSGQASQLLGVMTQRPIIPRWLFSLMTVLLIAGLAVGVPLGIRYLNEKDEASEEAEQEAEAVAPTPLADVRGKPYADALQELVAAGFKVVKAPDTVEGGTADQVAEQQPAPGDLENGLLAKGSTVTLKVFAGVGEQILPYLRGATLEEAQRALSERGFSNVTVASTGEPDQMIPAGTVLKSQPDASPTPQKLDTPIQLILSAGPPPVPVPSVDGKSIQDARNLLIGAGFIVSPSTAEEPTTDPTKIGTVLRVLSGGQPVGATELYGSTLDLVLGIDTTTAQIPDLTNLTQADAEAALTALGLQPGSVTTESSDVVPAGQVISFAPPAGQEINKGSGVDLVLSSGPAVSVLDFTGRSVADADALVRSIGLVPAFQAACTSSPVIFTQSPAPGTPVQAGSTVDLYCTLVIGPFIPLTPDDLRVLTVDE